MGRVKFQKLSDSFGIEILNVDLTAPLDVQLAVELRSLFFQSRLLLFRDQAISPDQQIAFMSIISKVIHEDVILAPDQSISESLRVPLSERFSIFSNTDQATLGASGVEFIYHADYMYTPIGAVQALSLWAQTLEQNAPTTWANMVHAVRALPVDLRGRAEHLAVDNLLIYAKNAAPAVRSRMSSRKAGEPDSLYPHSEHPVIQRHPVTGEEYLTVSQRMSSHVVGWSDETSDALFEELGDIAYAPDNTYRHDWREHDFIAWDNIALQHKRSGFPGSGERTMRRVVANPYELRQHTVAAGQTG